MKHTLRVMAFCIGVGLALPGHASDLYVSLMGGQSTVEISGIEKLEGRLVTSGVVTAQVDEKKKSTTSELRIGYILSRMYGLKVEVGVIEGVKHVVHTSGKVTAFGLDADFTVHRVVEGRGYELTGIFEKQTSEKTFLYLGAGVLYAKATADIYPLGSPYSVGYKEEGLIPTVTVGGRIAIDSQVSFGAHAKCLGTCLVNMWGAGFTYRPK